MNVNKTVTVYWDERMPHMALRLEGQILSAVMVAVADGLAVIVPMAREGHIHATHPDTLSVLVRMGR